jgi:hypothetical protein
MSAANDAGVQDVPLPEDGVVLGNGERSDGPPDPSTLRAALHSLDPNCGEPTRTDRRLKPIARAAREYPNLQHTLKLLAENWVNERYWGKPCTGFVGRFVLTGLPIATAFGDEWERLLGTESSAGDKTLGTLYSDAGAAGWPGLTTNRMHTEQQERELAEELRALELETIGLYIDLAKRGKLVELGADELTESLAFFYERDPTEFDRMKAQFLEVNPQVPWTAIEHAVEAFVVDGRDELLEPHREAHRKHLSMLLAYFQSGVVKLKEPPRLLEALEYLRYYHPVQHKQARLAINTAVASAASAALNEAWSQRA